MHLRHGLTPEEAGRICRHQCRARCCRGPQGLRLTAAEVAVFRRCAASLGVPLRLAESPAGTAVVRFRDHPGERCPMLDGPTCTCRIYADRPARCREFPDQPRPGCAISGG